MEKLKEIEQVFILKKKEQKLKQKENETKK